MYRQLTAEGEGLRQAREDYVDSVMGAVVAEIRQTYPTATEFSFTVDPSDDGWGYVGNLIEVRDIREGQAAVTWGGDLGEQVNDLLAIAWEHGGNDTFLDEYGHNVYVIVDSFLAEQ